MDSNITWPYQIADHHCMDHMGCIIKDQAQTLCRNTLNNLIFGLAEGNQIARQMPLPSSKTTKSINVLLGKMRL